MVSVKEDTVNFDKLEEELYQAVEADERYNRENDAKFRAVNQKVATYDEFRWVHAICVAIGLHLEFNNDKFTKWIFLL